MSRGRRRPPAWLIIAAALAVMVAVAWVVRQSPTVSGDEPPVTTSGQVTSAGADTGTATDGDTTATDGTTAQTTTEPAGPVISANRRAMARMSTKRLRITNGRGREKLVALTFDDGPGPLTKQFLSTLNRLGVKATFYVQGGLVAQYPKEMKAMVAHGHEVGIHTWNHPPLTTLYGDALTSQVYDTRDVIREYAGVDPGTMRPPYGDINDRVMRELAPARLVQVLWDVDTNDWRGHSSSTIVDHVLANATAGSIVLMHDGGTTRQATLASIEPIVNGLRAKGVEFVTVEELLVRDPPREALPKPSRRARTATGPGSSTAPATGGTTTGTAPAGDPVTDPASSPGEETDADH